MGKKHIHPMQKLLYSTLALVLFMLLGKLLVNNENLDFDIVINIFIGIILQAVPFLIIGVLLSSAIQIFLSPEWIENHFPRNSGLGIIYAIIAGFFLPVCDCASIPIFRSLVKKNIPITSAVVFMMATPIINPVAIMSTYYAFSGNIKVVITRIVLGIIVSVATGVTISLFRFDSTILLNNRMDFSCSCDCTDHEHHDHHLTLTEKWIMYLEHAKNEFFIVGKYLIIGAFVAAIFQTVGTSFTFLEKDRNSIEAILIMMGMAFLLSLCSSSDAIVGRSFLTQFSLSAVMGFLVLGPILDIKNMIMLSGSFTKRFISIFFFVTITICFVVISLFANSDIGAFIL